VRELAPGLHGWTARHPEWHPQGLGPVRAVLVTHGGPVLDGAAEALRDAVAAAP
jgi:hypothetical protein